MGFTNRSLRSLYRTQRPLSRANAARDSFLRLVLKLDAGATAAVGLLSAAAAALLDNLLGLPPTLLVSVGVFLIVYAALVWLTGTRPRVNHAAVQLAAIINLLYTLGCLVLVALHPYPLTGWGVAFILVQAAAVALFAALQLVSLRRSRRVEQREI